MIKKMDTIPEKQDILKKRKIMEKRERLKLCSVVYLYNGCKELF